MKSLKIILPTLLLCSVVFLGRSQTFTQRFEGLYEAVDSEVHYDYFIFDGRGKVDIMGFNDGYYFQKDDTLIVFPDKSLFKFLIQGDTLIGVSDWVKGGRWYFKAVQRADPLVVDSLEDRRSAVLLNEYYDLTNSGSWSFLFNNDDSYEQALRKLCVEGLTKACLDYAGLRILADIGIFPANATVGSRKREPDPGIIELLKAVIEAGDTNGYMVLGGYWASLGYVGKAKRILETGMQSGCKKCGLTLINVQLQETPLPAAKKNISTPRRRKAQRSN